MNGQNDVWGFAIGIQIRDTSNPARPNYLVHSSNRGIPHEMILSIVRAWLKTEEGKFYQKFSKEHLV